MKSNENILSSFFSQAKTYCPFNFAEKSTQSPLDVPGVNIGLDAGQIVQAIRESRYTGKDNPNEGNSSGEIEYKRYE